jgi:hypothetical protein
MRSGEKQGLAGRAARLGGFECRVEDGKKQVGMEEASHGREQDRHNEGQGQKAQQGHPPADGAIGAIMVWRRLRQPSAFRAAFMGLRGFGRHMAKGQAYLRQEEGRQAEIDESRRFF